MTMFPPPGRGQAPPLLQEETLWGAMARTRSWQRCSHGVLQIGEGRLVIRFRLDGAQADIAGRLQGLEQRRQTGLPRAVRVLCHALDLLCLRQDLIAEAAELVLPRKGGRRRGVDAP